ncbi:glucuronyl esterase domain-containing protein [Protaetiibacter intestinalis]|nr:sugar-binding protein [Protaetiibacter intestinalis]
MTYSTTTRRRRLVAGAVAGLLAATAVPLGAAHAATPASPAENLTATFVAALPDGSSPIVVDGVRDAGYPADAAAIDNAKNGAATADVVSATSGQLRATWDGRVLYLLVEVADGTPSYNATLPEWGGSSATDFDGVEFALDFWNDKLDKFEDDDGLFTVSRDGKLSYVPNAGVVNHSSVHAFTGNREYSNRIRDFAVTDGPTGYTVELALEIQGAPLVNGTSFGIETMIGDSPADGSARDARVYWSHSDNGYPASSQDHPMDWGNVILGGWDGNAAFAFDDWDLRNQLRWAESSSLVKGVWSADSQAALDAALANGHAVLDAETATDAEAQARVDAAAAQLRQAIAGLRWVDDRYPDPMDLPEQLTLPDPWTFFDGSAVASPADWWGEDGRRAELLDLAQFYEYGYKPGAPDAFSITGITEVPANPGWCFPGWGCIIPPSPAHPGIEVSISYGGVTAPMTFDLYLPSDEERTASGHEGPVPVVLSFGGYIPEYTAAGFAVLNVPTSVTTDDRNSPWGTRAGTFRTFFPYTRDGDPDEISNEMAAAWGASRAIDALELAVADGLDLAGAGTADSLVSADDLAVTGFSINGKYAFVSGVFDDRIDVTMPSAAGSTGPAPYRYASTEVHDYAWGSSSGSEVMGDTIRHNPGRTTELFRRFLEPFHFYERVDGAHGYGLRLPYDQNDLVATLAPRAIVVNHTLDDYADNSEGDALSLTVAKLTYEWLGYDGDDLVKYNYRDSGGHGEDATHRARASEYLDHYFYGSTMTPEVATALSTDPFLADGAYDRYFGGLETIAPWMHSRDISMEVALDPVAIIAGESGAVDVSVTGANLADRELTATLLDGEDEIASVPLEADPSGTWKGRFALDPVPAAGEYLVRVTVAGQDATAEATLTVRDAPTEEQLGAGPRDEISGPASAAPGDTITVHVGASHAGQAVEAWLFSTPRLIGRATVGAAGTIAVTIPDDVETGSHRLAVLAADGTVIGWYSIEIRLAADPSAALGATGADVASTWWIAVILLAAGAGGVGFSLVRRRRQPVA